MIYISISRALPPLITPPRYRTLVRAVRLGYNVLMTDNDVVLFDDPYMYFKSPPFSDFTVLIQQEWLDTHKPNGGFIYIQNASPNGPAVWLFTEVCGRHHHTHLDPPSVNIVLVSLCRQRIDCSVTLTEIGSGCSHVA